MLGTYQPTISSPTNAANSFLVSSLIIGGMLYAAVQVGAGIVKQVEERVDVTFVDEIKIPEPEPEPPKPVELPKAPPPPPGPEPVVAKNVKKIVTKKPIVMKKVAAPIKIRKGPLAEADASAERGVVVYADPDGQGSLQAQPLPKQARAPVPLPSNREPEYPLVAKKEGRSGLVILKLVVDEHGSVADVRVLRGEDPFLGEAMKVVKGWKFKPATVGGEPISVYHVVKIPFRYQA